MSRSKSHSASAQPQPDAKEASAAGGHSDAQRLDKWLWFARIVKTRTLATRLVAAGKVRVDGAKVTKPSHTIRPGAVLTIMVNRRLRILEVRAPGTRRGPASEAQTLYEDRTPDEAVPAPARGLAGVLGDGGPARKKGRGRPTKRERRQLARLRGKDRLLDT